MFLTRSFRLTSTHSRSIFQPTSFGQKFLRRQFSQDAWNPDWTLDQKYRHLREFPHTERINHLMLDFANADQGKRALDLFGFALEKKVADGQTISSALLVAVRCKFDYAIPDIVMKGIELDLIGNEDGDLSSWGPNARSFVEEITPVERVGMEYDDDAPNVPDTPEDTKEIHPDLQDVLNQASKLRW
eukprot:TRINITY_DN228_c0_g1_i1.p1 TRINITY_DN228_c0_g1~~TRINITY_DN228_c0_g1_i1.p1  ORF type:complete len:187 (-),score=36.10 TRINITY_DN228_c0_g1_i1:186-746(-)